MTMRFERLCSPEDSRFAPAMALYRQSFPAHEQRELASQIQILSRPAYHFTLAYDGERPAALLLYWETADFLYVEHFCVEPALRSRGYGRQVLELLKKEKKPVILEIDPPMDDISRRRRAFYTRCGFEENAYPHTHPPYHAGNHAHALVVMSCPERLTQAEYDAFRAYLRDAVMAGCGA